MADALPVGLYLDVRPDEYVDLEVAASAATEWARALRAAGTAVDGSYEYRVGLIAAEHGSSKWLAWIERSKINKAAVDAKQRWEAVPLIMRLALGLAVVIPVTAQPTYEYWSGNEEFSEEQIEQLKKVVTDASADPVVKAQRQRIYKEVQRDRKITGLGGGVADRPDWKPKIVPANQFPIEDGLFEPQEEPSEERIITPELDVILVSPNLHNAPRVWTFRQDGIPGTFNAAMRDRKFLEALERSAVRETFRADIPMRVRLQIKQEFVGGEWKVKRQGRSVSEVILPKVE